MEEPLWGIWAGTTFNCLGRTKRFSGLGGEELEYLGCVESQRSTAGVKMQDGNQIQL